MLLPKRPPPFPSPFKYCCCCPVIGEATNSLLFVPEVEEEMGNKRFWGVEEETKAEEEDAEGVEDEEGIIGGGNNSCGKKPIKLLIK